MAHLEGLVVLELASVLAGPSVGQWLAELGATVLKVENARTDGDVTRRWGVAPPNDPSRSSYFAHCNWGKQSLAIDVSTGQGQQLIHDLASDADIILSSFRPGAAERLAVDPPTLHAINPSLLILSFSGYGPDDDRPGFDAAIQAEAGFMSMNGEADGPPLKMPVALMDILAAHQAKQALLLALLHRQRTGLGQHIDIALYDAAISALANQATNWLMAGQRPQRQGSAHPNIAPYGTTYTTADGRLLMLAVGTDSQFERLCDLLDLHALPNDARFLSNQRRVQHRHALTTHLAKAIAQHYRDVLLASLASAHIPAAPVRSLDEVFASSSPLTLSDASETMWGLRQAIYAKPNAPLTSPPRYAEHTALVLQTRLGLSTNKILRLAQEKVIACHDTSD
ncbi:MAG: CaiB/BaiF CoA-transferase family protein [Rhodothermales bacterium]